MGGGDLRRMADGDIVQKLLCDRVTGPSVLLELDLPFERGVYSLAVYVLLK